jgi:hypothetical protein
VNRGHHIACILSGWVVVVVDGWVVLTWHLRGRGVSDGGIGGRGDSGNSGDSYENKQLYPHLPRRRRCGGVLTTPA